MGREQILALWLIPRVRNSCHAPKGENVKMHGTVEMLDKQPQISNAFACPQHSILCHKWHMKLGFTK
jgi:hypothetical protein